MDFNSLIDKGIELKTNGKTNLALDTYKQALDVAENDQERERVWGLVLHIHTDKMLATLIEISEICNVPVPALPFNWVFGTNTFNPGSNDLANYTKPDKESLFR